MERIETYIKLISAIAATITAQFLGGFDMWLRILVTFIILDFVTGVLKAIYTKKLSSDVSHKGGIRKVGILVIVAVAVCLDILLNTDFLRTFTIGFYICHEGISILENLSELDLPIPEKIKDVLIQLENKANEGDKDV